MSLLEPIQLIRLQRQFDASSLVDVVGQTRGELERLLNSTQVMPGQTVGLAVGSRGIAELPAIVHTLITGCRDQGLIPVIVPAMGSHGGASAAGQTEVLIQLGITANGWGVEVRADMQTELLGQTEDGCPIHFSRAALSVDHLLLCNRIKPHTRFTGPVQSGLQKMLTIGLGKQIGAAAYHQAAHHYSFESMVSHAGQVIRQHVNLLGGIAIVENADDAVTHLEAVTADRIAIREPELLKIAQSLLPRLPLREIDLLIVDEIGKQISGTGMDTNIIGRKKNDHVSGDDELAHTRLIYVRSLSAATAGNATGIGMAEFTNPQTVAAVDWKKTAVNAITAGHPTAAMCPVILESDKAVLEATRSIVGAHPRIVHIKNTLQLKQVVASASCAEEILSSEPGTVIGPEFAVEFDPAGQFRHCVAVPSENSAKP